MAVNVFLFFQFVSVLYLLQLAWKLFLTLLISTCWTPTEKLLNVGYHDKQIWVSIFLMRTYWIESFSLYRRRSEVQLYNPRLSLCRMMHKLVWLHLSGQSFCEWGLLWKILERGFPKPLNGSPSLHREYISISSTPRNV